MNGCSLMGDGQIRGVSPLRTTRICARSFLNGLISRRHFLFNQTTLLTLFYSRGHFLFNQTALLTLFYLPRNGFEICLIIIFFGKSLLQNCWPAQVPFLLVSVLPISRGFGDLGELLFKGLC